MRPFARLLVTGLVCAGAIAAAGPPPGVSITNGKPGAFVLQARTAVKLRLIASIESLRDGKWSDVSQRFDLGGGYRLVAQCESRRPGKPAADACVELAADAKLVPVPWSGMSCSSQCNGDCDKNVPLPAGDYRLVVTTCDGATSFAGPAFHFDGKPH
jgi:hypothetical protein